MPLPKYKYHLDKELTDLPVKLVKRTDYALATAEDFLNETEYFISYEIKVAHSYEPLLVLGIEQIAFSNRVACMDYKIYYDILDGNKTFQRIYCERFKKNLDDMMKPILRDWLNKELNVKKNGQVW